MQHLLSLIRILAWEKSSFELTDGNDPKYKEEEEHNDCDIQYIWQSHEQRFDCNFQTLISSYQPQYSQNFESFEILGQDWSWKQRKNNYCKV